MIFKKALKRYIKIMSHHLRYDIKARKLSYSKRKRITQQNMDNTGKPGQFQQTV